MRPLPQTLTGLLSSLCCCLLLALPANAQAAQRLTASGKTAANKAAPSKTAASAAVKAAPGKTKAAQTGKGKTAAKSVASVAKSKPQPAKVAKPATKAKAPTQKGRAVAKTSAANNANNAKKQVAAAKTGKARTAQAARQAAKKVVEWTPDPSMSPLDSELQLTSKAYMVMDAKTGGAIVSKNPDTPRQPASTIKIVTGLIALNALANHDIVPVSRHAAEMPSSKVYIQTSKTYSANDMINSVLLASANDASVALAERIAGSEERFAQLMTYNARRWGATNTVCRTASGLTAEGQQSTARDLAQLFRVAMQNGEFARRMHARTLNTSFGKTLKNHNKALWNLDGAVAGKTGYTNAARQTYVGQFSRDGHSIVVAIMGSETMWTDLEKLVDYGFRQKRLEMARARGQGRM